MYARKCDADKEDPPPILFAFRRGAIDEESPSYSTSAKITPSPSSAQSPADARPGTSRVASDESPECDDIQETRKDSALYLEEGDDAALKKILRSRPPGIFRKARRESSGYATSQGSFDEDRKGSAPSARSAPTERMPTTEIHRKVSSAGLDMPDIEEVKEIPRDEASPSGDVGE